MIWILLLVVVVLVGYFAWKSTEVVPTIKLPAAPKIVEPVMVEPVKDESAAAEVKKVRKKYGGKVKKQK
jgi:hypothetical protein